MEQWYLYCKKADFGGIAKQFSISPMLARILRNRDIQTQEEIRKYLHGDLRDLYDPMLMKGMKEALLLVTETIRKDGKIRIIGDYDVDGVCSAYILKTYLTAAGAVTDVRLPDRISEGYGMNQQMAEQAAADGIALLITCDNGISSIEAVKRARDLNVPVIVTDHHEPSGELPPADAIIDPKQKDCPYPFRELCGGAVAFKFVQALDHYMQLNRTELLQELLQFAGMATITDIVPLQDENRIIAAQGIARMRQTSNIGLNALMQERGVEKEHLNAGSIGFILGPCINSAGRLKNAMLAFHLLEEQNPEKASEIAEELSMLNEERRFLTDTQVKIAFQQLKERQKEKQELNKVIVLYLPEAHESVAGIIAGRIKDEYHRPAIVVTHSEGGLKGSGRSTDSYNLIEQLQKNKDLFEKCGGHAKACGFTLKQGNQRENQVRQLSDRLNENSGIRDEDLIKKIWIDMQLPFKYVTESFLQELDRMEPFGLKNEKPVFAQKGVEVLTFQVLGKNRNTLKMMLRDPEGYSMEGLMFSDPETISRQAELLKNSSLVSVLYYPRLNEFRGQRKVQLMISSMQISGTDS